MEDKYTQLIQSINLDNIELRKLTCEMNELFEHTGVQLSVGMRYDASQIRQDGLAIVVPFGFDAFAYYGDQDDIDHVSESDVFFRVTMTFRLTYSIEELTNEGDVLEAYSDDVLKMFAENNVPINAWPYARELVSNVTTRMGVPSLIIPPFKSLPAR